MAGKKGENTKKAAGNAKKAEVAAQKRAVEEAKQAKVEDTKWQQGSKDTSKKDAAADKAAEAARKKAEKEALLKAEEESQPSKPKGAGSKAAQKKTTSTPARGLDLSQLEPNSNSNRGGGAGSLNASGIDDSIAALSLANSSGGTDKVERHPERRFKAAYSAYEERRLEEMKDDKSLRRQQKIDIIRKEFEKSAENPFNQALVGRFDMSKEEMSELRQSEREKVEERLHGD